MKRVVTGNAAHGGDDTYNDIDHSMEVGIDEDNDKVRAMMVMGWYSNLGQFC